MSSLDMALLSLASMTAGIPQNDTQVSVEEFRGYNLRILRFCKVYMKHCQYFLVNAQFVDAVGGRVMRPH